VENLIHKAQSRRPIPGVSLPSGFGTLYNWADGGGRNGRLQRDLGYRSE
jgi:hypothetical protein